MGQEIGEDRTGFATFRMGRDRGPHFGEGALEVAGSLERARPRDLSRHAGSRGGCGAEGGFGLRSQVTRTEKVAKTHLGVDQVGLQRDGGLVSRHRHLFLAKAVEDLGEVKVPGRHSRVETNSVREGLRGFLRTARRHERVAKVELNRRAIRPELDGPLQKLDGFVGPAGADQALALVGKPFGLTGAWRT